MMDRETDREGGDGLARLWYWNPMEKSDPFPPPRLSGEAPLYTPPGGPPAVPPPSREIFGCMGEEAIERMCADFYVALAASEIRPMFPEDMPAASRRLAAFLVGLLGGPPRYRELYGEPRLRARHLPFAIDERARLVWISNFRAVLADAPARYGFPAAHVPGFIRWLDEFSKWMVNRRS